MKMPDVSNVATDSTRNITFNVMAYRALSKSELTAAVRYFRSTKAGRKLKSNSTYTIVTTFGADGRS